MGESEPSRAGRLLTDALKPSLYVTDTILKAFGHDEPDNPQDKLTPETVQAMKTSGDWDGYVKEHADWQNGFVQGVVKPSAENMQQSFARSTGNAFKAAMEGIPEGWEGGQVFGNANYAERSKEGIASVLLGVPRTALNFPFQVGSAVLKAAQNVGYSVGQDIGTSEFGKAITELSWHQIEMSRLGRDLAMTPEAFPFGPKMSMGIPHLPTIIKKGVAEGIIGVPEDVALGLKEPTPQQRMKMDKATEAEVTPEPKPDIHTSAENINPEAVGKFRELEGQRDQFRAMIDDAKTTNAKQVETAYSTGRFADEVADLQKKVDEAKARGKKSTYEDILAKKIAERNEAIEKSRNVETPETLGLRKQLQETEYQMRDLSPEVSKAYREAAEITPQEAVKLTPDEAKTKMAELERQHGDITTPAWKKAAIEKQMDDLAEIATEQDIPKSDLYGGIRDKINTMTPEMREERLASLNKKMNEGLLNTKEMYERETLADFDKPNVVKELKGPWETAAEKATDIEAQRRAIADDITKDATAAGYGTEEAKASAEILARQYAYLADMYGGKKGTALELYTKEKPGIIKQGEKLAKAKTLTQSASGKYHILDSGRRLIRLMKTADASTFVHEGSHHFLDMMKRFEGEAEAPAKLKADMGEIRKWLGVKDDEIFTRKMEEKFARGFERYLMEGHAPTRELIPIFQKFEKWLTDIYKTVANIPQQAGGISDDIRNFFDRVMEPNAELRNNPRNTAIAAEKAEIPVEPAVVDKTLVGEPEISTETAAVKSAEASTAPISDKTELKPGEVPENSNQMMPKPIGKYVDKAGNIRLDNLNGPEDLKQTLRDLAERNNNFLEARGGVISDSQRMKMADSLGIDHKNFVPNKPEGISNSVWAEVVQKVAIQAADEARNLGKVFAEDGSIENYAAFEEATDRALMIIQHFSNVTAESGRTQRVFNKKDVDFLKGTEQALEVLSQKNNGMTLYQMQQKAKTLSELDTTAKVSKFIQDSKKPGILKMITEGRTAFMLWNPLTHIKNTVSNLAIAVNSVAETYLASGIGKALNSEERVQLNEANARAVAMYQGSINGWASAKAILKDEDAIVGNKTVETAYVHAIPGTTGKVIRATFRALSAEDQFFKDIATAQEVGALAQRAANKAGLTGEAHAKRVAELMKNPTEEMVKAAAKHADYQTLTKSLEGVALKAQLTINSSFILKNIVPFFRTNINSLGYFIKDRTVLGVASREIRDNLSGKNGAIARDTQIARTTIGTAFAGLAMSLVLNNRLTGGGPSDPSHPELRALWLKTHQPYSLRIGDAWYNYEGLQGFSTPFGMAADMAETVASGRANQDDAEKITLATVAALSKRILDIASLQGISDTVKALDNPGQYGDNWVKNYAASYVPAIVGQAARIQDPYVREIKTMKDAVYAKIPFLKETLKPRLDVFGQPIKNEGSAGPDIISPIYQRAISQDPTIKRLEALHYFPSAVEDRIRNVKLTDDQYDDYQRVAGRLMKDRLDIIVNQQNFASMPMGIQIDVIKKNVADTREQARGEMMMRYPSIIQDALAIKREAVTGTKH